MFISIGTTSPLFPAHHNFIHTIPIHIHNFLNVNLKNQPFHLLENMTQERYYKTCYSIIALAYILCFCLFHMEMISKIANWQHTID